MHVTDDSPVATSQKCNDEGAPVRAARAAKTLSMTLTGLNRLSNDRPGFNLRVRLDKAPPVGGGGGGGGEVEGEGEAAEVATAVDIGEEAYVV